ncbi:MAG TPA: hypothetical protein VK206_21310 [Anaerolineales bacterium]|nr:hypothetical protein [Anaerolineales bacterium]
MIRMTILLPVQDTIKHVKAICELSDFETAYNATSFMKGWDVSTPENSGVWLNEQKGKTTIGHIAVLPARENSVIVLTPESSGTAKRFDNFIELLRDHFQALSFLLDTRAEPWKHSPPDKQERDRTIWEYRNLGYTWEQVAEVAKCGVSTAKERYKDMTIAVAADSG